MTSLLKRLDELRKQADDAGAEQQRSQGALAQINTRLEEEFGCKSLAEAKKKLARLDEEIERAEKEAEAALEEFETELNQRGGPDDNS